MTMNRNNSRGSSLAYVLFVVVIMGVAATGMLHSLENEIITGSTRRKHMDMTYAAEAALEIAKGRLRLDTNRQSWLPEVQSGSLVAPFASEGSGNMLLSVTIGNPPGGIYDSFKNPVAALQGTAKIGTQTRIVSELVKESTASDFGQWWPFGAIAGPLNSSGWGFPALMMVRPMKGKVYINNSTGIDTVKFLNPAPYGAAYGIPELQAGPPYFEGEVVFNNLSSFIMDAGITEQDAFAGGIKLNVPANEMPLIQTSDGTIWGSVLQGVYDLTSNGGSVHTYSVPGDSYIFQIRIRGNWYEYRTVDDAHRPSFAGSPPYPWTNGGALPDAIVVNGYTAYTAADHAADLHIMPPADAVAAAGAPIAGTGGVQVWADNRAVAWEPACSSIDPVTMAMFFPSFPTTLDQNQCYYDGHFTIASTGSLEVMGSLRAANFNDLEADGGDMLGLIADNAIWLRNDSMVTGAIDPFGTGLVAGDRVQFLDAFALNRGGGVRPVYLWSPSSDLEVGFETSMAPPKRWRGAKLQYSIIKTRGIAWQWDGTLQTEVINQWPAPGGWRCYGFQNHELVPLLEDSVGLIDQRLFVTGYDPGFIYDERGLSQSPPGFPKVWNVTPDPIEGTWGTTNQ